MNPSELWIEVTEIAAVTDARAIRTLHELRDMGCTIALDDFGSGFSALACLQTLPLDVVKLDGAFIDNIVGDRQTYVIVESLLRIISTLGMRSVAERVESLDQLECLRELGCDMVQGYVMGRPGADPSVWPSAMIVESSNGL